MHESRTRAPSRWTAVRGSAALALLLLFALPASAFAHAEIDTATPADKAVLTEPPTEIVVTYTQGLDEGSSIVLRDPSGTEIARGVPASIGVKEMRATFAPLAPGTYTIESTTFSSEDGEGPERETVTFTVAEPTPPPATATPGTTEAPSEAPSAATAAAASPTPAATTAPGADGGGDTTADVLLPIVIVGLLIGGGLAFFLRRRSAA